MVISLKKQPLGPIDLQQQDLPCVLWQWYGQGLTPGLYPELFWMIPPGKTGQIFFQDIQNLYPVQYLLP